jgi:hypothetical protein
MNMALTVGTDTYISLADARTYATMYGIAGVEDGDDTTAEANLKVAARMLDRMYNNQWIGIKKTLEQSLAWPRNVGEFGTYRGEGESWNYTLDSDGNPRLFNTIPAEVGEAQVELVGLITGGLDVLAQVENAITSYTDKVDVLSVSRDYKSPYKVDPMFRVRLILRPLLQVKYGLTATRGA